MKGTDIGKKRFMKRAVNVKKIVYMGVILLSMIITLISIVQVAEHKDHSGQKAEAEYILGLEKEYVSGIREFLEKEGYKNSGVMLTRMEDGEGNREYVISIHHSSLASVTEQEKNELSAHIIGLAFAADNCSFVTEII